MYIARSELLFRVDQSTSLIPTICEVINAALMHGNAYVSKRLSRNMNSLASHRYLICIDPLKTATQHGTVEQHQF